jgi:antitoxin component of MazEF toxin-antitoxin module
VKTYIQLVDGEFVVEIPEAILLEAGMKVGDEVSITVEDGVICIRKVDSKDEAASAQT